MFTYLNKKNRCPVQRKTKPNFHDLKYLLFEKFFEKMFYFYHLDVSKNGALKLKMRLL